MRAALLLQIPADRLPLGVLPDPMPGPGELLVEVAACGICGTDLHILEGRSYRPEMPFVMGHEPVGWVTAAGPGADAGWVGRRVTMTLFEGDLTCRYCVAGDQRLCPDLRSVVGVSRRNGGFGERMLLPSGQAVAVPDGLDDRSVAALVDAGATAANAVRVAAWSPGAVTVVVGGGPIGFLCAELIRAGGGEVVVVQPSPMRRAALKAAAHLAVTSLSEVEAGADIVIDASGAREVLPWALGSMSPQGIFVGAGYGPVDALDLAPLARKEIVVRGVRSGRREDLERMLALVAGGTVRLPPVDAWALEHIDDAVAALRARRVPGKAVIDLAA